MRWDDGAGCAPLVVLFRLAQKDPHWRNLGLVPLHGALRVSRGSFLLYCSGNVASQPCAQLPFQQNDDLRARPLVSMRRQVEGHSTSPHATSPRQPIFTAIICKAAALLHSDSQLHVATQRKPSLRPISLTRHCGQNDPASQPCRCRPTSNVAEYSTALIGSADS